MKKPNKKYYGFRYFCGITTTTGKPNRITGRLSIAGESVIFNNKENLEKWLDKEHFVESRGDSGTRVQVNKKELRRLNAGMTMEDFNMMVDYADEY